MNQPAANKQSNINLVKEKDSRRSKTASTAEPVTGGGGRQRTEGRGRGRKKRRGQRKRGEGEGEAKL